MSGRQTDRDVMLHLLRLAGPAGVHTSELRRRGVTGNPSQRKAELENLGYEISATWERGSNGRPGKRYVLTGPPNVMSGARAPGATPPPPAPEPDALVLDIATPKRKPRSAIYGDAA